MQCTEISDNIQKTIKLIMTENPAFATIVKALEAVGARSLLVGGAVRDLLLGHTIKDLDIEVHHITLEDLENLLKRYGPVSLVGKSFGVLKIHGMDIDWAVPRRDSAGRKPLVSVDSTLSLEDAFRRRDLTINAMGIDLVTGELIDPFGGLDDLCNKILRAPDPEFFVQDPLRFYRVMQFIGRFGMYPDAQLNALCATMNLADLSIERIEGEFEKLCLKSAQPSLGVRWIDSIGRLQECLPELAALKVTPQDPEWHPEGDVFEHSMQAFDAAAAIKCDTTYEQLTLVYAALCHDLGKAVTTEFLKGRYRSFKHDAEGVPLAKELLKRITLKKDIIAAVCKLVHYHMVPGQFVLDDVKPAVYKRLALKLAPQTTVQMLANLMLADRRGRNPQRGKPLADVVEDVDYFLTKAREAEILFGAEKPVLLGRDLLDVVPAGPQLGVLLKHAYAIQIKEGIRDKEELKKRVLQQK